MAYKVLALKYRPQIFKDVIGQSQVTTTLENAIESDRVAHAILFTGPRGTGKTTTARILAKAINCEQRTKAEPCNVCTSCKEITSGNCADVFEIDGASNNNVDQIRELRENVAYLPASCKYKIYIIDEVHMLTTAAFNALLKTLEEPPEHILFIFATTEPNKIPATILSRCQRHNLGRVTTQEIADNIRALCKKEGYSISEKSADLIAGEADGSIRDSLSLTDRILSAANSDEIDHDSILSNLGLIDKKLLFTVSSAIIKSDGAKLIEIVDHVNESGLDLKKFYSNLIRHFRDLAVVKVCGKDTASINVSDYEKKELKQVVEKVSASYLTWLLNALLNEESMIKFSSHTKTAVEMTLLKLLQIRKGVGVDEIISKLDLLKEKKRADIMPAPGIPEPAMATAEPENIPTSAPVKSKHGDTDVPGNTDISGSVQSPEPPSDPTETKTWEGFIKVVQAKHPFIAVLFKKSSLKTMTPREIKVELHSSCTPFEITRFEQKKNDITDLCKKYFENDITLTIGLQPTQKQAEKKANKTFSQKKQEAMSNPLVADTLRIFNGTLIDIK